MPLSENEHEVIEAFRDYVEGSVEADDRYGVVSRCDDEEGTILASRFEAGPTCWLEVAVHTTIPQVRIAFLTSDESIGEEAEQAIQESGGTLQGHVAEAFKEAGLDWNDPPVERVHEAGEYVYFGTPLDVDDLFDLEWTDVRRKVVRMLEGYLIAFGPAIEVADEE